MTQRRLVWTIIAVAAALFLLFPLLLYAYRAQTPALATVPITQAVQEIQQGRVSEVSIEGGTATLTFTDGTHERAHVPDNVQTDPIEDAVTSWNRSNPQRQIALRRQSGQPAALNIVLSVLLSLLPLILIVLFIVLVTVGLLRARSPSDYDRLARAADLRDRGVLTEDEFQREKRKILH